MPRGQHMDSGFPGGVFGGICVDLVEPALFTVFESHSLLPVQEESYERVSEGIEGHVEVQPIGGYSRHRGN